MNHTFDFDVSARYQLLCRASQSNLEHQHHRLELLKDLGELTHMIEHDLPALARQGSPDDFADILRAMTLELEIFREFCEFPDLAQKVVVGTGGAFSAGKSSLINTILGKKRLVVEVDPTTSLPTYLLYGQQEQITALNLFQRRVELSSEEFASLTHEEQAKYGSQVAGLLKSAFISDPEFPWHNLALLDTPGYSKPEHEDSSERTDEHVARVQLNSAQFIIWVVSAAGGVISEDDLVFLASLNPAIPKLVVLSRADSKPESDIQQIVVLIKKTLCDRAIQVLDVIPTSARKKRDYPLDAVKAILNEWNGTPRQLSFAQNFKSEFTKYHRFIQREQVNAAEKVRHLNKIMVLADEYGVQSHALALKAKIYDESTRYKGLAEKLKQLEQDFFNKFNAILKRLSIKVDDFLVATAAIKNPECSPELLARFANTADSDLLALIVVHINCPVAVLVKQLDQPVNLAVLSAACLNSNAPQDKIIKHLNQLDWATKRKIAQNSTHPKLQKALAMLKNQFIDFELALREPTDVSVLEILSATQNLSAKLVLAKNTHLSVLAQKNILHNSNRDIQLELAKNKQVDKSLFRVSPSEEAKQIAIAQGDDFIEQEYLTKNLFCSSQAQHILIERFDLKWIFKLWLASHPLLTDSVQLLLAKNKEVRVRHALARNPSLKESTQLLLAKDDADDIRESLARNPSVTEPVQLLLAKDIKVGVRESLARNPALRESVQRLLVENEDERVLTPLASNMVITEFIQLKIAKKTEIRVKMGLARNTSLREAAQLLLAEGEEGVRWWLAKNSSLSEPAQMILAKNKEMSVIIALSGNLSLTNSVRFLLDNTIESLKLDWAKNGDSETRYCLAGFSSLPVPVQLILAEDKNEEVRMALVQNPCIALEAQRKLLNNKNITWLILKDIMDMGHFHKDIKSLAQKKMNSMFDFINMIEKTPQWVVDGLADSQGISESLQNTILNNKNAGSIYFLAKNSSLTETIQLKIAKNEEARVRYALATNPSLTETVQLLLAKDNAVYVREYLARNLSITDAVQLLLAKDDANDVRESLANNPSLSESAQFILIEYKPENVFRFLVKNPSLTKHMQLIIVEKYFSSLSFYLYHGSIIESLQIVIARSKNKDARQYIAENSSVTECVQLMIAKDIDDEVRHLLAKNTNVCLDAQNILAQDKQFSVRWSLFNNPNCSKEALNMLISVEE